MITKLVSIDWESALLSYSIKSLSFIKVNIRDENGKNHSWKSIEANNIGRIELNGLLPDSLYKGTIESSEDILSISFKTLPPPQGKKISSYAIIADPHISCKTENRKGRFLAESAMILSDVVQLCNSLEPDYVLIPGDITNDGTEKEYALSAKIVKELKIPIIATPGNHDIHHGESSINCWNKYFPTSSNIYNTSTGKIVALNTSKGDIISGEAKLLYSILSNEPDTPVIIISHYQLFNNEHINRGGAQKFVNNSEDQEKLLNLIKKRELLIYVGHQNVCSVKKIGKSFQINSPQPVQHPCGFLYVSQYENGFYHKFIPISSEILRAWSYRSGEDAMNLYNENQWESFYREGKDIYQTNFFIKT